MTLPEYISKHLKTPFVWGQFDCVIFSIGWVSLQRGRDYLEPFGSWKNELAARRKVAKHGGFAALFNQHLKSIPPNYASDGCIAIVPTQTGQAVGVFTGPKIVTTGLNGLVFLPRTAALGAWQC